MAAIMAGRKEVVDFYNANLDFSKLSTIKLRENTQWNYSYYPVLFETEEILLQVLKALNEQQIFPRRYFYPSLNTINYVANTKLPVSESIASRILCLPLYMNLDLLDASKIVKSCNLQ